METYIDVTGPASRRHPGDFPGALVQHRIDSSRKIECTAWAKRQLDRIECTKIGAAYRVSNFVASDIAERTGTAGISVIQTRKSIRQDIVATHLGDPNIDCASVEPAIVGSAATGPYATTLRELCFSRDIGAFACRHINGCILVWRSTRINRYNSTFDRINGEDHGGIAMLDTAGNLLPGYFEGSGCGGYFSYPYNDYYQGILGIEPAQDGGYYIYGYYRGYDDGATNDPSQRLLSKLYGLNVGINEQPARSATLHIAPNPSHGGAVQLSVDEVPKRAILSIHDASGRVVLREEWPDGTFTHTLQAGLLAPGTYVVRVAVPLASRASASGTDTYTGKMIVLP